MITLEVNPAVLQALKVAFPRPNGSAERALGKYVQVLTRHFDQLVRDAKILSHEVANWIRNLA